MLGVQRGPLPAVSPAASSNQSAMPLLSRPRPSKHKTVLARARRRSEKNWP
jgi:hypothetical protein